METSVVNPVINPGKDTPDTTLVWTLSGLSMLPHEPIMERIIIHDIAHSLSMICRFNGHIRDFYSVGEHSLHVERLLELRKMTPLIRLYGLVHDITEFLIGDIVRPVKRLYPEINILEDHIALPLFEALGIPMPTPEEMIPIHIADRDVMREEKRALLHPNSHGDIKKLEGITIIAYPPKGAAQPFVEKYFHLMNLCNLEIPSRQIL